MNTIQFTPRPKEPTYETVNRALTNAQQNNKDVVIRIFGETYTVKATDTYESVSPLKALLHTRSQLELVSDKLSAKI